jgi:hypothetical protein
MLVLATARISVPCISKWLISSLLCTWHSQAPAKLTPLGSSLMVTTGRGAAEFVHSRSRTSSCKQQSAAQKDPIMVVPEVFQSNCRLAGTVA